MIHGFAADGGDVEDDDLDHLKLAAEIVKLTLERSEFWCKRARREAALRNARLLHTRVLQETPSTPGKVDDAPPTVGAGSVDEEEAPGVGGGEVGVGNGLGDVAVYGSDRGDAATLAMPRCNAAYQTRRRNSETVMLHRYIQYFSDFIYSKHV